MQREKRILSEDKQNRIKEQIECAICMDVMENAAATPCGHSFCVQCIRNWLFHGTFCPVRFFLFISFSFDQSILILIINTVL